MRRGSVFLGLWLVAFAGAVAAPATGTVDPHPGGPGASAVHSTSPTTVDVAARAAHTATAMNDGTVLVAGGCVVDGCTIATSSTAFLDGGGGRPGPPMIEARDAHTATLLPDGRVLIVGGFTREGIAPLATAELYSPFLNSWTPTDPGDIGRGGHAAAVLGDGRVLIAGGWVGSRRYTGSMEIFDPATAEFTPGPALPQPVDGLAATALPDGSVLLTGGQSAPEVGTATAVLVDRTGRTATVLGDMNAPRFKHTTVLLPSGEVLVIGGTPDDRRLLASTEIYDPRTRTFRWGPSLTHGRYKLSGSAAALPDGRVVVAGGGIGAEVIDTVTSTSRSITQVPAVRSSFSTVTITPAGAFVVGGYDEQIRLTGVLTVVSPTELPR